MAEDAKKDEEPKKGEGPERAEEPEAAAEPETEEPQDAAPEPGEAHAEKDEAVAPDEVEDAAPTAGDAAAAHGSSYASSSGNAGSGESFQNTFDDFSDKAKGHLDRAFPGHATEAFWACVGFVVALLVILIGFWRVLVIVLFVILGIGFGQYLEGDPKIFDTVKGWFGSDSKRR